MRKKITSSVFSLFAMVFFSSQCQASPISIYGLDVSMSIYEAKTELEKRDFTCSTPKQIHTFGIHSACKNSKYQENNYVSIFAETGDAKKIHLIEIDCAIIGTCDYSHTEVYQMIVEKLDNKGLNQSGFNGSFFCGRGDDGDVLCVSDRGPVKLERGTFGKSKPSFD
ncbi:hypothetical protein U5801_22165 [Lamprobacter modestohalophilus]|uniref:hypothetical protein n=1 Tax=Lamprobacter modestohalophilus TaxID=1064514 RepID=UPI002ADEF7F1|nr:hypothetical protein [Lamprobacter modestohalophilus]MEA1052489.1 hypothetical protein [Lamprobacter modestohalophilus]